MKKLRISPSLTLPVDVVTESIAILAIKRVGKSITAKKLFEQLHHADQQVGTIDPKGDWWGVLSSADGKRPGLPVLIFGGDHGHVPIEPSSGELVAQLVVRERVSFVIDTSGLSKGKTATFMADFLETLYMLKAKDEYRTPMMLFIDEADAIAPQKPQANEARMLGAAEDIVRRGGQRGLGVCLITQRTAVLNKNVLTQCGVLFLLRTTGSQDVDAIDEWIRKHGNPERRAQVLAELASLPKGTAWVWAPGWPDEHGIFQRVAVDMIETFDSGRTPKPGEKPAKPKTAADVDLGAFRSAMAETIERAKANDPTVLRARVKELEAKLAKAEKRPPAASPAPKVELVKVPVITEAQARAFERGAQQVVERFEKMKEVIVAQVGTVAEIVQRMVRDYEAFVARVNKMSAAPMLPAPVVHTDPRDFPRMTPAKAAHLGRIAEREVAAASGAPEEPLPTGARSMLNALATMRKPVTRHQLATLAGMSVAGGSFRNNLSILYTRGLIAKEGEFIRCSGEGVRIATPDEQPRGCADLVALWKTKLPAGAGAMLDYLVSVYPSKVDRQAIAMALGMELSGGSFRNNLSMLSTNGLIEKDGAFVRASESLYIGGS